LLFSFQSGRSASFWSFCITVAVLGFTAEVIGVHLGWFFGHYLLRRYAGLQAVRRAAGHRLNWLILTYACGILAATCPARAAAHHPGGPAHAGLDMCIEPVASTYDFWHWTANVIPFQNFRDWFILACVLQMLFNGRISKKSTRCAAGLPHAAAVFLPARHLQ
jgi:putative membrane protein